MREIVVTLRIAVEYGGVVRVEGVFCGVQSTDGAPGVIAAALVPIEVEEVIVVVAVAYKSMPAGTVGVRTAIKQRSPQIHPVPLLTWQPFPRWFEDLWFPRGFLNIQNRYGGRRELRLCLTH